MAKRRNFTPEFKAEVVLEALCGESSQAELCRKHNISDVQLSKWKRQLLENAATLFEAADKQTHASAERIAQLEQLVGKLTLELDIQKSLNLAELTLTEKRRIVETLRTDYSMRQISGTLGFNRSSLYYETKEDPCEAQLQQEIEILSARYPRYGYRRIIEELLRMGYTIGYRRVARLMKSANLLVSVKRSCQTTKSVDGKCQWINRLDTLDICRRNQVWVADVTYVQLKGNFVYVSVLLDVFTRIIRGWQLSRLMTQPLTLRPLQQALQENVPEIHHSDQGVQYLSDAIFLLSLNMGLRFR